MATAMPGADRSVKVENYKQEVATTPPISTAPRETTFMSSDAKRIFGPERRCADA